MVSWTFSLLLWDTPVPSIFWSSQVFLSESGPPRVESALMGPYRSWGVLKGLSPGSVLPGLRRRGKRVTVLARSNSLFPMQATDSRGA